MSEPKQHIVVEGVEFSQLFHFPKIVGEAGSAFQPGRLVIGLFMVVLLMTTGQIWDVSTTPGVHPDGLLAGTWSDADREQALPVLRAGLAEFSPESAAALDASPDGAMLDARTVLDTMADGFRRRYADEDAADLEARVVSYRRIAAQVDGVRPRGVFEALVDTTADSVGRIAQGVLMMPNGDLYGGADVLFRKMPAALWKDHKYFTIVYGFVLAIVMALGGGALSRMSACQRAGLDRLTVREAFFFAFESWPRLLGALILPLVLVLGLSLVIAVVGMIATLPWVDVVGGLFYGVGLLLGLCVVFLLVGYLVGFIMLVPAVACENCDAADAQQRAYAYVINRPLHLLGYLIVAVVTLAVGYLVAGFIASTVVNATAVLTGWFSGNAGLETAGGFAVFDLRQGDDAVLLGAWHERWLGGAITFWQAFVSCLVGGYLFAYLYGASTTIYLLMRRVVDGQNFDEIWLPGHTRGTYVASGEEA